ncbi:MAG: 50S ribosomal protein L6 [Candidatus Latescibacteria bacterium]|nr:50S ribosomal protein L6 [Candidatus Latescibacterota bacterium]
MSRIGKMPITIPSGVDVKVNGERVSVKGPKGELTQMIDPLISTEVEAGNLIVTRSNESKQSRSLHGLSRSLLANMVEGVTDGFTKVLEIQGIGYRAEIKGQNLTLLLGYSHPIIFQAPPEINIAVEQNKIQVGGIDKQLVGQVASIIRAFKKPEPYKGKGIMYEGEYVRRKAGKTGV